MEQTSTIRERIVNAIAEIRTQPISSCTKAEALKIFKKSDALFATPEFDGLLLQAVPLISAGFVREKVEKYPHEEMLRRAKTLVLEADELSLAEGFIFGVTHKEFREYILPFVAYHFFKNFPTHEKTEYFVGEEKRVIPFCCGVCEYCDDTPMTRSGAYYNFLDAFIDAEFLYRAKTYASYSVNHALYCLEEGLKFPKIKATKGDFERFISAIRIAESVPSMKKAGAYKQALHRSKILPLTGEETQEFINVLSYLNILHPKNMLGFAAAYTPNREQTEPNEHKNDYAYPVCHWRGADGVDYAMIEKLFGKLEYYQY